MANENPSRDSASKQQSSERAQSGSPSTQQGAGAGSQRSGGQGTSGSYGSGSQYDQGARQGTTGTYGSGSQYDEGARQGTSTWQGGRSEAGRGSQSGALQRRGGSSLSPFGSGYESGYGGGPFSIMRRITDEMDRFFENFGMGRGFFPSGSGLNEGQSGVSSMWSPHIDVCERNGKLLIQADLPGIKRDDINVRIEQDAVVIQGHRHQQQMSNQSGYYRSERSYGSFYRTIPLPEGTNAESATASFRDGVLEIEVDMPREQQRGRTLEIHDAGSDAQRSSGAGTYGTSSGSTQGGYTGAGGGALQSGHAGTGSGATYGSGTSGSMQGSASGAGQHAASSSGGSQQSASGSGASQQSSSGTTGSQQSSSGTTGSQQSSGAGTIYSGSGDPSEGPAGIG
jgi:HSP20 family protein